MSAITRLLYKLNHAIAENIITCANEVNVSLIKFVLFLRVLWIHEDNYIGYWQVQWNYTTSNLKVMKNLISSECKFWNVFKVKFKWRFAKLNEACEAILTLALCIVHQIGRLNNCQVLIQHFQRSIHAHVAGFKSYYR